MFGRLYRMPAGAPQLPDIPEWGTTMHPCRAESVRYGCLGRHPGRSAPGRLQVDVADSRCRCVRALCVSAFLVRGSLGILRLVGVVARLFGFIGLS